MEVAVCFFGITRSLAYVHGSIQKNILDVLADNGYNVRVFLHTYDLKEINTPRNSEINAKNNHEDYKLLNPHIHKITSQEEFDKSFPYETYMSRGMWEEISTFKNVWRQYNSLKIVTDMWTDDSLKFSCVIYLRPDLYYFKPLQIRDVEHVCKTRANLLYLPDWIRTKKNKVGVFNDRIAMGTPDAMAKYGNRLNFARNYSKKLIPEQLVYDLLKHHKIEPKNWNINGLRVRHSGAISTTDIVHQGTGTGTNFMIYRESEMKAYLYVSSVLFAAVAIGFPLVVVRTKQNYTFMILLAIIASLLLGLSIRLNVSL